MLIYIYKHAILSEYSIKITRLVDSLKYWRFYPRFSLKILL